MPGRPSLAGYWWVGFCSVELVPSPKSHFQDVICPCERSLKATILFSISTTVEDHCASSDLRNCGSRGMRRKPTSWEAFPKKVCLWERFQKFRWSEFTSS